MDNEIWYLLFKGESCDSRGTAEYDTRTKDNKVALQYFDKLKSNPYSFGYVVIVTNDKYKTVFDRKELINAK